MKSYYHNILLIVCFLLGLPLSSSASHFMGGEITWECQSNGQYIFTLKLYRDCQGTTISSSQEIDVHNHPTLSEIDLSLSSVDDISPECGIAGQTLSCGSGAGYEGNGDGAVEEHTFKSAAITLTGTPPSGGWIFSWDGYARNNAIDNLDNPSSSGMTLRAVMYPYNNQSVSTCYDSSPFFAASASTVLCMGYPFTYNHLASDNDMDSLSYNWAEPLDQYSSSSGSWSSTNPSPLTFQPGFSYTSPLPGVMYNANNVPATLNSNTGEISYTCYNEGSFVTVIKVESWRCGQLIAEIYRDIQITMYDCSSNNPPDVNAPFPDGSGAYTLYADTVTVGDLVTFSLNATDFEMLPNGSPQTMNIEAYGIQFGNNYSDINSGCPNPPCATLNPAPVPSLSGPYALSTAFSWQTDCSHLNYTNGCFKQSNTYTFVVNVYDDYCPAPSMNNITFTITVEGPEILKAPEIKCVSIEDNGDVTVTWQEPEDMSNSFESYHIYASNTINGAFTKIDSIFDYTQTSYTVSDFNAQNDSFFVYMETRSGCGGVAYSNPSDTAEAMILTVINVNETAVLSWNNIINDNTVANNKQYYIYRKVHDTWDLADSTSSLSYIDSVSVCEDSVFYKVSVYDSVGCYSTSCIDGDLFHDLVDPDIPVIKSVDVNEDNFAEIYWEVSTSEDVIGYVVYQEVSGVWQVVDTVWGLNNLSYLNSQSGTDSLVEYYRIAAFDSCNNISPMSDEQNNILVSEYVDLCSGDITLSWNEYNNWLGGVSYYDAYALENNTDTIYIGSVNGTDKKSIVFSLVDANLFYCYFIVAVDSAEENQAHSNRLCVYTKTPQQPKYLYNNLATVYGNSINISGFIDTTADIEQYKILRSVDSSAMELLDYLPAKTSTSYIKYTDSDVGTMSNSYYYQFIAIDSCGEDGMASNISRTMLLQVIPAGPLQYYLDWNKYESWMGGVKSYNIYRSIDNHAPELIATNGLGSNYFMDDLANDYDNEGHICYYIEAIEGEENIYMMKDTSYSNRVCVDKAAIVLVPSSFTPNGDGNNDEFKPSKAFLDRSGYEMRIFDRWGHKIFFTVDPNKGWDGTIDGEEAPLGAYVYHIKYYFPNQIPVEKMGGITLIR